MLTGEKEILEKDTEKKVRGPEGDARTGGG